MYHQKRLAAGIYLVMLIVNVLWMRQRGNKLVIKLKVSFSINKLFYEVYISTHFIHLLSLALNDLILRIEIIYFIFVTVHFFLRLKSLVLLHL